MSEVQRWASNETKNSTLQSTRLEHGHKFGLINTTVEISGVIEFFALFFEEQ